MRRLIQHTVRVLTLVALLISTSGWVLHRHWCPEGKEQVLSLNGPQACDMEDALPAKAEKACCQAPVQQSLSTCDETSGCCKDAAILLQLTDPFLAGVSQEDDFVGLSAPEWLAVAAQWREPVLPPALLVVPEPPPPLSMGVRLSVLQVYLS